MYLEKMDLYVTVTATVTVNTVNAVKTVNTINVT